MDDYDDTPIVQAHRIGRLACEAQARGHWQQAIDKHTRAAQQFTSLQAVTTDPQALLALGLLSQHHIDQARIIERTLYHETPTPRTNTPSTTLTQINNINILNHINTTLTPTSLDSSISPISRLLSLLRNKPFEMDQQDFQTVMSALEELRIIVAKPNLPSQAVRKSPADIETDLQSHLSFGREVSARLSSVAGRPDELLALRDMTPALVRQHASLAQNEAILQRENEALRQTIHMMQETYAQKSQVINNALTTSFRPMRATPTITATSAAENSTPILSDTALLDANKLLTDKLKLEKQVHILSKQLKAEMAQVKKQAALIQEQQQRWHNLKEAARVKRERERNKLNPTGTPTPSTSGTTTGTTNTAALTYVSRPTLSTTSHPSSSSSSSSHSSAPS